MQIVGGNDAKPGDRFGWTGAVCGRWSAVSAIAKREGDDKPRGAVYVYRERDDGTEVLKAKLTAPDADPQDQFGTFVRFRNDRKLLIGAVGDDEGGAGAGAAYVFKRDGHEWGCVAKLMAGVKEKD